MRVMPYDDSILCAEVEPDDAVKLSALWPTQWRGGGTYDMLCCLECKEGYRIARETDMKDQTAGYRLRWILNM